MYPTNFGVTEGKKNAWRNVYIKLRFRNDQVLGPLVTRGRSKTSKSRSLNGRTRFFIPIVTRVTPGFVDVRFSDAAQR